MKTLSTLFFLTSLLLLLPACSSGQQFRPFRSYDYNPELINPALKGSQSLHSLRIIHQTAQAGPMGINSMGQALIFSSSDLGYGNKFAWGMNVSTDFLWVRQRYDANASLALHIVDKRRFKDALLQDTLQHHLRVSLGAMAGLYYQNTDLNALRAWDPDDPLILSAQPRAEPNLGTGIAVQYRTPSWQLQGGWHINQLPELLTLEADDQLQFHPHTLAHLGGRFHWRDSLWFGGQLTYRESFGRQDPMFNGDFTLNTRVYWSRYHIWAGLGYRPWNRGMNFETGLCISKKDQGKKAHFIPYRLDVNAIFDYSLNEQSRYGATWELGLSYSFGSLRRVQHDTISIYLGPVWLHSGNLNRYLIQDIPQEDHPRNLYVRSENEPKTVALSYEFADDLYQYDPEHHVGLIRLLEHIGGELLVEAFRPGDPRGYTYPEHLGSLEKIEFQCFLREDRMALNFLADSVVFTEPSSLKGELVYDQSDTSLTLSPGKRLTNFELAYLKMHKLREAFLRKAHGALNQEQCKSVDPPSIQLISNNPNLESWQKNRIVLTFRKNSGPMRSKKR